MIQRIQSVYLLLAAFTAVAVYKLPFASVEQPNDQSLLFSDGCYQVYDNFILVAVFAVLGLWAASTIFFFRNRKLQIKLSFWGAIISAVTMILVVLFFSQDDWARSNFGIVKDEFGLGMPLFSLLFFLLARYYIAKDERKVQSMDRLR